MSNSIEKSWTAKFSDGQSARSWPSTVRLDKGGIVIMRDTGEDDIVWPYGALKTPTPLSRGSKEAFVTYTYMPDAQLFVTHSDFVELLARRAPQLTTASHRWRWAKPFIALALLIVMIFSAVWLLDLQPARTIAGMLPEDTRQTVGRNVIAGFTAQRRVCNSSPGKEALNRLMGRLLKDVDKPDYFHVTVIDWKLVNAFAAPGGQMVITSGLIRAARTPEEVAGVLAHEIGHGIELHPEAGVVRAIGLSAALELLTGGSSGTLSNLSAVILQNSYVRQDERAADMQALQLLRQARISQNGLADFFQRISGNKASTSSGDGKSERSAATFGNLLRTHPYPEERARTVRASARYSSTPAMPRADWRALKQICSSP
ncbi:MAG: M48 family metallopeptidase [Pseudomonadota bacterium]